MSEPITEMLLDIGDKLCRKTGFPNCVGAIDGKHVQCSDLRKCGSNSFNYKKVFSVELKAMSTKT